MNKRRKWPATIPLFEHCIEGFEEFSIGDCLRCRLPIWLSVLKAQPITVGYDMSEQMRQGPMTSPKVYSWQGDVWRAFKNPAPYSLSFVLAFQYHNCIICCAFCLTSILVLGKESRKGDPMLMTHSRCQIPDQYLELLSHRSLWQLLFVWRAQKEVNWSRELGYT